MNQRALAAELVGTFMLMAAVLGAFYAFGTPSLETPGGANLLGIALTVGFTAMALAFAVGHVSGNVSGAHLNPAVTLGLIAGGRVAAGTRRGLHRGPVRRRRGSVRRISGSIGRAPPAFAANGYGALSPTQAGMLPVVRGRDRADRLSGVRRHGRHQPPRPGRVRTDRAGGDARCHLCHGHPHLQRLGQPRPQPRQRPVRRRTALGQVWLFWVAPILGGVIGGAFARWVQEE